MAEAPAPGWLEREERQRRFGIDCESTLEWSAWAPGGDYVRQLRLQNRGRDVVKLRYELPSSPYFFMPFPKLTSLSPGMCLSIPVHFRPIERAEYRDAVRVVVVECGRGDGVSVSGGGGGGGGRRDISDTDGEGKRVEHEHKESAQRRVSPLSSKPSSGEGNQSFFFVAVHARLPRLSVSIPELLDFECCAVAESSARMLTLVNDGEMDIAFSWSADSLFSVSPERGELRAGDAATVKVIFRPLQAACFDARLCCLASPTLSGANGAAIDEQCVRTVRVAAVARFPFLSLSASLVDFGTVLAGSSTQREVTLSNCSSVPVTVRAVRRSDQRGLHHMFSLSEVESYLLPGEARCVRVAMRAFAPGISRVETFEFVTPSGISTLLSCKASCVSPQLQVEPRVLEFGDVECGDSAAKVVTLTNLSSAPIRFAFAEDEAGSFVPEVMQGTVPAGLHLRFAVRFAPLAAINYSRRLFLLVQHAAPIVIECVGTSFLGDQRPMPLSFAHVERHRARVLRGLARVPPGELLLRESQLQGNLAAAVTQGAVAESASDALFLEGHRDSDEASIAERLVDFGPCPRLRLADYKLVHVTNHSSAKLTCVWDLPDPMSSDSTTLQSLLAKTSSSPSSPKTSAPRERKSAFVAFPQQQDILPGETVAFRLSFRPQADNYYYHQKLKCYCFYKTNRSFRLVDPAAFVPPICLSVEACGSSFAPLAEQFLPTAALDGDGLVDFADALPGEARYQTFIVRNEGHTPCAFRFVADDRRREADEVQVPFAALPPAGLIEKGRFAIVTVRFNPHAPGRFCHTLVCRVNNSAAEALRVTLQGTCSEPRVELEDKGRWFFPPVCIGIQCRRAWRVRNLTGLTCNLECKLRASEASPEWRVAPRQAILAPYDELVVAVEFAPRAPGAKRAELECAVSCGSHRSVALARLRGDCGGGAFEFSPAALAFDVVQVGVEASRTVTLCNTSDCAMTFRLRPDRCNGEGAEPTDFARIVPEAGELPPRSDCVVQVLVRPPYVADFRFALVCSLAEAVSGEAAHAVMSPRSPRAATEARQDKLSLAVCDVSVTGWFPQLRVVDARMEGHAVDGAWRQLSIDALNAHLHSNEWSELERALNSHSLRHRALGFAEKVAGLPQFALDMGTSESHREPAVAYLQLKNTGPLCANWALELPPDHKRSLELWEDFGQETDQETMLQSLQEQRRFQIEPRGGCLLPGESATVMLAYVHGSPGNFAMPALLSVEGGHRAALLLRGSTVERRPPAFHFAACELQQALRSVEIGLDEHEAPVQEICLVNPTDLELRYRVDGGPLEQLRAANFGFGVLECLNPEGTVAASGVGALRFRFRPLETRQYETEVRIITTTSDMAERALRGESSALLEKTEQERVTLLRLVAHGLPRRSQQPQEEQRAEVENLVSLIRPVLPRVPTAQTLIRPGQIIALSSERVAIGQVTAHSVSERTVTLTNLRDEAVEFCWRLATTRFSSEAGASAPRVRVQPEKGVLRGGESVLVRFEFSAGSRAAMFRRHILCEASVAARGRGGDGHEEKTHRQHAALSHSAQGLVDSYSQFGITSLRLRTRHSVMEHGATRGSVDGAQVGEPIAAIRERLGRRLRDGIWLLVEAVVEMERSNRLAQPSVIELCPSTPTAAPQPAGEPESLVERMAAALLRDCAAAEQSIGRVLSALPRRQVTPVGTNWKGSEASRLPAASPKLGKASPVEAARAAETIVAGTLLNVLRDAMDGTFDVTRPGREIVVEDTARAAGGES